MSVVPGAGRTLRGTNADRLAIVDYGPLEGAIFYETDTSNAFFYDGAAWQALVGVDEFTELADVPASYIGQGLLAVRVNAAENALEFFASAGGHAPVTLDAGADTILELNVQEIQLDDQSANTVLAGPAVGPPDTPTFRQVIAADIDAEASTDGQVMSSDGAGNALWEDAGGAIGNHDHSGDAGDGGTFDAANLTSGAALAGDTLTADGAGGADWVVGGDMLYTAIQASTLVNEIQGWPPYVPDAGNLVTLNLWFRNIGTPTSTTVVHTAGEGITETFERCIKHVADAASEGFKTLAWTYADQPRIKSGRKLSTMFYIWCAGGVGVTAKLVNSDASHTDAAPVSAAAWTLVEIPNHSLAGTWCELQFETDGAGTFYVAELSANIGARAFPLGPRPLRYVENPVVLVNAVDPGGVVTYTDVDATANASPLAVRLEIAGTYYNGNRLAVWLYARRNGSAVDTVVLNGLTRVQVIGQTAFGRMIVNLDDGNVFEWRVDNAVAGDTELVSIGMSGYWEWE